MLNRRRDTRRCIDDVRTAMIMEMRMLIWDECDGNNDKDDDDDGDDDDDDINDDEADETDR